MSKKLVLQLLVVSAFAGTQIQAISISSTPNSKQYDAYTMTNNTAQTIYVTSLAGNITILQNKTATIIPKGYGSNSTFSAALNIFISTNKLLFSPTFNVSNDPNTIIQSSGSWSANYTVNP